MAEKFEPISPEDAVPEIEKEAFKEMQNDIELGKSSISEDPQLVLEIEKMIETLPNEKEKEVIRRRFFKKETLEEIGKSFNVGPERIRQLESKALRHFRHPLSREYVEGVELGNREDSPKDQLNRALWIISDTLRSRDRREPTSKYDKQVGNIVKSLSRLLNKNEIYLRRLNKDVFNKIYDDLEKVGNISKFDDQVVDNLESVKEKLKDEIKQIKNLKIK